MPKLVLDFTSHVELANIARPGWTPAPAPSFYDIDCNSPRYSFIRELWSRETPMDLDRLKRYYDYEDERRLAWGRQTFRFFTRCPHCRGELHQVLDDWEGPLPEQGSRYLMRRLTVVACSACGWWDSRNLLMSSHVDPDELRKSIVRNWETTYVWIDKPWREDDYEALWRFRRAILREWDIEGIDVPVEALRKHLLKRPDDLSDVNPSRLEHVVGRIFSDHFDCEVVHLGGPRDGGVDLLLVNGDRTYVVQVKRRSRKNATEGVSIVREFLGAMVLGGYLRGLIVTSAKKFSKDAQAAAKRASEKGIVERIDLIDGKKLLDICKLNAHQAEPWRHAAPSLSEPIPPRHHWTWL